MVTDLNSANFDEVVKKSALPVVVFFTASWVKPAKEFYYNVYRFVAEEKADKYLFARVDIDLNYELEAKLEMRALPTFLFYKRGVMVSRYVGAMSRKNFEEALERELGER